MVIPQNLRKANAALLAHIRQHKLTNSLENVLTMAVVGVGVAVTVDSELEPAAE
jgi:hypothetical protein